MATPERPLSPYTSIYRWQITMTLSILHRITGVVLAIGAFGLAWWLLALSGSVTGDVQYAGRDYDQFMSFAASIPGRILIVGFCYCLIYHLLNGIRHLFWDAGKGFEIKQFQVSGWAVVLLSFALTAGFWALAPSLSGGMP